MWHVYSNLSGDGSTGSCVDWPLSTAVSDSGPWASSLALNISVSMETYIAGREQQQSNTIPTYPVPNNYSDIAPVLLKVCINFSEFSGNPKNSVRNFFLRVRVRFTKQLT